MQISAASKAVGAWVEDVDIRSISDSEFEDIQAAFFEHGVLFFKDQYLTPNDHRDFALRWSDIDVNRFFTPVPGHPDIAEVLKEPDQELNIGGGWHTDHSYDEIPAMGSILYALEIPAQGGDTMFAGMAAAYEALPDDMKSHIADLRARHGNDHVFGKNSEYRKSMDDRLINPEDAGQEAVHPIVLTHPQSGKKGLYVNPGFTLHIEGMETEESAALLEKLYKHAQQPQFHYRLKWSEGTLAMWDNRATWHYALNDYQGHRRHLHRITMAGQPLH